MSAGAVRKLIKYSNRKASRRCGSLNLHQVDISVYGR